MMEYQGYVATVEYDDSVQRLHGRVVNTGQLSHRDVRGDGRAGATGGYLNSQSTSIWLPAARNGVEPAAPFSGKLQLRLGSDLHRCVAQAATESGQSINSWISKVLAAQAQK